jgi:Tfp pilus assembly protein PilN
MIRINLANALMKTMDATPKVALPTADHKELKANILKGALILVPIIGIFLYEKTNLTSKQNALEAVVQEKQNIEQKLTQVGSVDDVIRQVEQQKIEVDRKVGVVRKIFSMRKQKLNSILSLQTHIPRSAWLQRLEFSNEDLKIIGMASSTEDAQTYASLLSQEKDLFAQLINKGVTKTQDKEDTFQFEYHGKLKE